MVGTFPDTEDILVDKTNIPVLMELMCQKIFNTYEMIVIHLLFLKSLEQPLAHGKGHMSVSLINQIILCVC